MDNRFMVNRPINPTRTRKTDDNNLKSTDKNKANKSFKEIFNEKLENKSDIKFSRHARSRMTSRNINFSEKQFQKLKSGMEKLEEKGAQESLVMVDEVAYVVSVKNKTVITAIDDENVRENVFTNIDSAVLM